MSQYEVPICTTVEEGWELIESSQKNKVHCMMLENVCYGDTELAVNAMCEDGVLGEIVHAEAAYNHDFKEGSCIFNTPLP